jgi:hypothetical protein
MLTAAVAAAAASTALVLSGPARAQQTEPAVTPKPSTPKPVSQTLIQRDADGTLVITAVMGGGDESEPRPEPPRDRPFSLASALGSSPAAESEKDTEHSIAPAIGATLSQAAIRIAVDDLTRSPGQISSLRFTTVKLDPPESSDVVTVPLNAAAWASAGVSIADSDDGSVVARALGDGTARGDHSIDSDAGGGNSSVLVLSDTSADFTGAGGGGGGGAGAAAVYVLPLPVVRSATVPSVAAAPLPAGYVPPPFPRRGSKSIAPILVAAGTAPPSIPQPPVFTMNGSTSTITAKAALAGTPAPVYAGPRAVSGVVSTTGVYAGPPAETGVAPLTKPYPFRSLQPTVGNWVASQVSTINGNMIGGFVQDATGNLAHAAAWAGPNATLIDLHPSSGIYMDSHVLTNLGNQFVGFGYYGNGAVKGDHALFWTSANAGSAVDLNPVGWRSSYAEAITPTQQVGYGLIGTSDSSALPHAAVWTGSAASIIDLNPGGYLYSLAFDGDGIYEVGYGLTPQSQQHALLWQGLSNNAKDIHPTSGHFLDSRAVTLSGSKAGGFGTDASSLFQHAILWNTLDGGSAVDLNPVGYEDSQVLAMNSSVQSVLLGKTISVEVGLGRLVNDVSGNTHALVWFDATGYIDLNQFLPARYVSAEADAIDANGNIVGWAKDGVTGYYNAVEWLAPIPEPTGLATAAAGALWTVTIRRRGRRRNSPRAAR